MLPPLRRALAPRALENIYLALIIRSVPHDAVPVKRIGGVGGIAPPRKVAQGGEALRFVAPAIRSIVFEEERGCKKSVLLVPWIGGARPAADGTQAVL